MKAAFPHTNAPTQPLGGLTFEGHGAYGSNFDPMDGRLSLIINICDDCLESKGAEGKVAQATQPRQVRPEPTYTSYTL